MSWLDKVKNDLVIVTGDGVSFSPNWMRASKEKEYNVSEFEYFQQPGTLVFRNLPKGRRYNLEIYFQGDDCIELAQAFEDSADDPRAWTIKHPFYGNIIVQPLGLLFDNGSYNVSKITGTVVETIVDGGPKGTADPVDKINFDKTELDTIFAQSYGGTVLPTNDDINILIDRNTKAFNIALPSIKLDIDAQTYFNLFNQANAAALQIASDVQGSIIQVQNLFNAPAQFGTTVKIRISMLQAQYNVLRESILNLSGSSSDLFNKNTKKGFENSGGMIVSSAARSAVTNMDYNNRNDVILVIEQILALSNLYFADLDLFQSPTVNSPDAYIPDVDSMIALSSLVNFTVSSLFTVALESKQERALYCESDTNVINLAHRLYGLQPDDSTIATLIANNEIGLLELLQIKKGRKIIWYV